MPVKQNTAEGGTNLVTVTAANSGGLSGDAFDFSSGDTPPTAGLVQFETALKMHGSLAYQIATRGTSELCYVAHSTTAAVSYFGRFYFAADAPASALPFCSFRVTNLGNLLANLRLSATGQLTIREPVGATSVYTFTTLLSMGTFYRIEYNLISLGGTSITLQVRLYLGDSTVLLEDSGVVAITTGGTQADWGAIRFGVTAAATNNPSATGFWYFDDLYSFAGSWPGPSGNIVAGPPPLIQSPMG